MQQPEKQLDYSDRLIQLADSIFFFGKKLSTSTLVYPSSPVTTRTFSQ